MKHSGFVSGVILILLLVGAAVGVVFGKQWVLPLVIVCFTLWVLILLIKHSELTQENTRLTEANAMLAARCGTCEHAKYLDVKRIGMRTHDNECA